jgi:hypothetical protein
VYHRSILFKNCYVREVFQYQFLIPHPIIQPELACYLLAYTER